MALDARGKKSDFVHCLYALAGYNGMVFTPWVTLPGEKTPDVHRPFHPGPPPVTLSKGSIYPKVGFNSTGSKNARNKCRNLERRDSDFSNHPISKIESRIRLNPLSRLPSLHFKPLPLAPMRRGRKVKSQGFVRWLTATANH
ncbi:hypothetical protein AVEN_72328-1 [Araneus ventricosus]|uniref:Uncharacterized protein n=1 Tax=Araneus ventricosus TaxID=182803 RepID=A0A4Y2JJA2_ARAVE|nr:hypothetical protein AVEN_72328-1 [Araneus ventricosus]